MKNLIILFIVSFTLLSSFNMNAQDEQPSRKPRINEIGVTTQGFTQFGLDYKLEKKNNWYWRFSTIAAGGNADIVTKDTIKTTHNSHYIGVGAGIEKRIHLNPDFQFKYGFGINTYFNTSVEENEDYRVMKEQRFSVSPGASFILGFNYLLGDHFIVSAEFAPTVNYSFFKTTEFTNDDKTISKTNAWGYSINTSSVILTIAYRLWKGQE